MSDYYCEYCGSRSNSVASLTAGFCIRHPAGPNKGRHKLYEGRTASAYTCKFCGSKSSSISSLTAGYCIRHPSGANKGRHAPSL